MRTSLSHALAALAVLFCFSITAFGDGLIIVENPDHPVPGHFPFAPLEVKYHHVDVSIDDQVATTSVDQEFYNPSGSRTEGAYIFPLPPNSHIDKFSMDINGRQAEAELLSADKARAMYEDIVRKMRDPALLEYSGRDAFKVRIFPIEPHGTKHVKITYTQVLKADNGLVEYSYPLNTEKFSSKLIGDVSVTVKIKSPDALKNVYCPSHNAEIKRHGENEAVVGYEEKNARPDTDFRLLFSREKKPVGSKLLSYKKPGTDDGYFMLMASPGFAAIAPDAKAAAKDIAFVVDTSGSMADRGKLEQAKKALNFCLANLNADDRFDIVRFSTEAEPMFGSLKQADAANVEKARSFVDALKPTGGTAIDAALSAALKLREKTTESSRPFLMIFLTDGLPTVGITDEDKIVSNATSRASDVRIFCFGVGFDVNTHLLDRIADATRGVSQYVLPHENIEVKVSSFYEKIREPVMTDVKLALPIDGIATSQVYPSSLPDIFKGETLLVFGRFSGKGQTAVTLSGNIAGKGAKFTEDVNFDARDSSNAFIATVWATRRVGWLLDEMRIHGENAELKDEVVKLAREHGIVTPYTAYLIIENESRHNVPVAQRTLREMETDAPALLRVRGSYNSTVAEAAAPAQRSGAQAVANAQAYDQMKRGMNAQQAQLGTGLAKVSATTQPAAGYRFAQNYAQQVKLVNGRAFYQNGDAWSDASLAQQRQDIKRKNIRFNSDEYFALLRDKPAAAQWLALGNNVDLVIDDTLYSVRDN
jgi:Ca-activated chloride channel family protein